MFRGLLPEKRFLFLNHVFRWVSWLKPPSSPSCGTLACVCPMCLINADAETYTIFLLAQLANLNSSTS